MKLGPVTKLNERNKPTSKKFEDDIKSANRDVNVTFPFYGQFGAIWKPDSRCIVFKITFSLTVTFHLNKN